MENNLSHAGIKGMKWGVRRFQNKDGSLTPEGKRRYGVDDESDSHEDYKSARSKSVKNMSDSELRRALDRVRMEEEYRNKTAVQKSAGRKWVENVVTNSGQQIATKFLSSAGTALVDLGLGVAESYTSSYPNTNNFIKEVRRRSNNEKKKKSDD